MESDAEMVSFRDSLCHTTEQLTTFDFKQLKFLCSEYIPVGNLEQMDTIDLMQTLHERRIINQNKIVFLVECLLLMGRMDVAHELCPDNDYLNELLENLSKYKSTGGLSSFKILVFDLADNITEIEVKKIILYLDGTPGISKGKIKTCASGFDLITYLMNVRYVDHSKLDNLIILAEQLRRVDLLEKIKTYKDIMEKDEEATEYYKKESPPKNDEKESTDKNESPNWKELVKRIPSEKHFCLCEILEIPARKYVIFKDNFEKLLRTSYEKEEFTLKDLEKGMEKLNLQPKKKLDKKVRQLEKYDMTAQPSVRQLEKYDMTAQPRGICLIIDNEDFKVDRLPHRKGSHVDRESLQDVFKSFYFEIDVVQNLTSEQMNDKLKEIASRDHENYNCFVCCILSHGASGIVYGIDGGELSFNNLTMPFKPNMCKGLTGKPKLFFIQACQGNHYQVGVEDFVESDGSTVSSSRIPNEADFLLAHATVQGFVSFRSRHTGSWFIQALCEVLKENAKRFDLLDMLLMVNNRVSELEGNLKRVSNAKQVPAPLLTLRKKVYFLDNSD